jgi:hypothetical protein
MSFFDFLKNLLFFQESVLITKQQNIRKLLNVSGEDMTS